ncbi:metallophosphoesterase family protein [Gimesia aquarii]|uniref:Calcineurin-like phosphoesterase n=1 Tax=Gimesia aquarii TaxID=2527964 RepID=A0A517WQA0_9PLAN|nr:metallophosphoesterase [Gimesia aquarii]QDU07418.1 Calcineurin-like phosphoesterase [Gimesia aquarii]
MIDRNWAGRNLRHTSLILMLAIGWFFVVVFQTLIVSDLVAAEQVLLLADDFESYSNGQSIIASDQWKGYEGFPGKVKPIAVIKEGVGIDGSKAIAVSHAEPFRTDGWGIRTQLAKPVSEGVVWLQCRFKPPQQWKNGTFFDMRGQKANEVIARIAAAPFQEKGSKDTQMRWHSVFNRPYWRLYTKTPFEQRWHTMTARINFDLKTYACWVDHQTLGEEMPLTSSAALSHIYLGVAGTPDDPALIDNLIVSRTAPEGFDLPRLLPKPDRGLIFRFAAVGDPQLGFGGFETDKARFAQAIDQINRSGAEQTFMLGDMVHEKRDLKLYDAMTELVKRFDKPYHYVRGNHEIPELFLRYFFRDLHYSVVHKGVRFVVIDAEGNHVGLNDKQLDWIESEFQKAEQAGEEIVIALHVSPWQNNERGRGKYNQIGKGRDRLRAMMKQYKVLLSLSGHYHRALWHAEEEATHYLVLGGAALVSQGAFGWCTFDVYPDRIVVHQKPLHFAYEKADAKQIHTSRGWLSYKELKAKHPYAQQGPLTIKRHRPVSE